MMPVRPRYPYPNPADFAEGRKWLPALGDEDAPVVVMEFSDIYCGHCRDFNLDALPGILEDYVASGKVRWTDHFFGFNRTLQEGTVLALMCAAEQGRYFEFKHTLFQSLEVGSMDADRAARVAGLDESPARSVCSETIDTCRQSRRCCSRTTVAWTRLRPSLSMDGWSRAMCLARSALPSRMLWRTRSAGHRFGNRERGGHWPPR